MIWFWHILLGVLIGIVARLVDPDKDRMNWVVTIIVGIVGSVGAVLMGLFLGWYGVPSWTASGVAAALAIVFVAMYARTKGKRHESCLRSRSCSSRGVRSID